jgi:hypothetical protein
MTPSTTPYMAEGGVAAVRSWPLTPTFNATPAGLPAIKRGAATFHSRAYPVFRRFSLGHIDAQHGAHLNQGSSRFHAQRSVFQSCRSAGSKVHHRCSCAHRLSRRFRQLFVDAFLASRLAEAAATTPKPSMSSDATDNTTRALRTGWPMPVLNQDCCRPLFEWFASKPEARQLVREACAAIRASSTPTISISKTIIKGAD